MNIYKVTVCRTTTTYTKVRVEAADPFKAMDAAQIKASEEGTKWDSDYEEHSLQVTDWTWEARA